MTKTLLRQHWCKSPRRVSFLASAALAVLISASTSATAQIIYNSIPSPLPGNVVSFGPEANAFSELGDGIIFKAGTGRMLSTVKVILSDWACTSGHWYGDNTTANGPACVTTPEATFNQLITMNIYTVSGSGPAPGVLLATDTAKFEIPYRPSSTPAKCAGDATVWYDSKDHTCYHGIAAPIVFDFSNMHLELPNKVIVTVAFDTTHYGHHPIGQSAPCYTSSGGCPYDSLNISTDGGPLVGAVLDPNGIFVNYTLPNNSCSGTARTGVLADDTPCWTGFHPEIEVKAKSPCKDGNQNGDNQGDCEGDAGNH
jgi:hypothetical protein